MEPSRVELEKPCTPHWQSGGVCKDCRAIRHTRKAIHQLNIPTWNRTRAWTFGGSNAIRYTIGTNQLNKSRRLDSHQHPPVYKTVAFLSRATSAIFQSQARARGVEPRPSALETDCCIPLSPSAFILANRSAASVDGAHSCCNAAPTGTSPWAPHWFTSPAARSSTSR